MDVVTHIALGVCTSELCFKGKAGKKFLVWGAFVQVLPDIDTIPALFLPADRALMIHRGITHSLFFALVGGLCLAVIGYRIFKSKGIPFVLLLLFCCFQLSLHDSIDLCNSYGTALLEPFSHERFSFNLLFVADPVFTTGLIVAAAVLLFRSMAYANRSKWALWALGWAACYIIISGINKIIISNRVVNSIAADHRGARDYLITPAPFTCMLWYIVIDTDSVYYTGYVSVFDSKKSPIKLEGHLKNHFLTTPIENKDFVKNFREFAGKYYTITQTGGQLYINILRFEQIQGWKKENAPFVSSFPLAANGEHAAALQKRRLEGWDLDAVKQYIRRITGSQL